jgi:hypothetical protein
MNERTAMKQRLSPGVSAATCFAPRTQVTGPKRNRLTRMTSCRFASGRAPR